MTTVTLELPDQLAAAIQPLTEELPVLLTITQQLFLPASDSQMHTPPVYLAYKQFFDFLASNPSPEECLRFTISPTAEERVHYLLDRHGEGDLSLEEEAELRIYAQINEIINLKKAEALLALTRSA